MRILFLTKYDRLGASSRLRALQYIPTLERAGITCIVSPLISNAMLEERYAKGSYGRIELLKSYLARILLLMKSRNFDLVWVEKEALPWLPATLERLCLFRKAYMLDYDDAVFHLYDSHRIHAIRWLFGSRLDYLMRHARLVVGGNGYLTKRAMKAGASWVEKLPTVIDLDRYLLKDRKKKLKILKIVWIGSPSTSKYLYLISEPLKRIALKVPYVLRVIGAKGVRIPGVEIEEIDWDESSEVDLIMECDIGIMPLETSTWEEGKCGYKLIQYMACGLPVVASAVGANLEIVQHEKNGFLAADPADWENSITSLLVSGSRRAEMGSVGRKQVEDSYCIQQTCPKLIELFKHVAQDK